jgi:hypothetical protein
MTSGKSATITPELLNVPDFVWVAIPVHLSMTSALPANLSWRLERLLIERLVGTVTRKYV